MLTNKTLPPPPMWRYTLLGISEEYQLRTKKWFDIFGNVLARLKRSQRHYPGLFDAGNMWVGLETLLNSQMARLHTKKVRDVFNKVFGATHVLRQCGISDIFEVCRVNSLGSGNWFKYNSENGYVSRTGENETMSWACSAAIEEFTVFDIYGQRIYSPHARQVLRSTSEAQQSFDGIKLWTLHPDANLYTPSNIDENVYILRADFHSIQNFWLTTRALEETEVDDHDNDDDDDDDDDYEGDHYRHPIGGYHSSRIKQLAPSTRRKDGLMMGFEIEIEDTYSERDRDTHLIVETMLRDNPRLKGFVHFESDGSLDRGFEMISNYGYLEDHTALLPALAAGLNKVSDKISAGEDTTGMHIHVNKAVISPLKMTKLIRFMHAPINNQMLSKFAQRLPNSYCKVLPQSDINNYISQAVRYAKKQPCRDRQTAFKAHLRSTTEKYSRLNLGKAETLEFRMWASTADVEVIEARLQFVQGLVRYVGSFTAKTLIWEEFIDWAEQPQNVADMRKFLLHVSGLGLITKKTFHLPSTKTKKVPKPCV